MGLEIERKFLVKGDVYKQEAFKTIVDESELLSRGDAIREEISSALELEPETEIETEERTTREYHSITYWSDKD